MVIIDVGDVVFVLFQSHESELDFGAVALENFCHLADARCLRFFSRSHMWIVPG